MTIPWPGGRAGSVWWSSTVGLRHGPNGSTSRSQAALLAISRGYGKIDQLGSFDSKYPALGDSPFISHITLS